MSSEIGPLIGLGIDVLFGLLFYTWYKRTNKTADELKDAKMYKLGRDLMEKVEATEGGYIGYGCVEGEVQPVKQTLLSMHKEEHSGVVRHILLEEHKSKRVNGVWTDVKNSIQDKIHSVPFVLQHWLGGDDKIRVEEPMSASFLADDLTVVHDSFTPNESGNIVSRGIDRLFGEVVKGYHETEKMLLTNTWLLGVGELAIVDGSLTLRPPRSGAKYILTKKSKAEIIKSMESKSFWIKVVVIGTGVIGATLLCHIIYKQIKRKREERKRETFLQDVRALRLQAERRREESEENGENRPDEDLCLVCLANPREIVLLNCGHLCLCAECVTLLPEPLVCPVCRQNVERYITTYRP